jgi:hypothetical protein
MFAATQVGSSSKTNSRVAMANNSVFSIPIAALHKSRRLQAARLIRTYQYLLHEEAGRQISEKIAEPEMESRVYTRPARGEFLGWKGLGAKSLMTLLVLGFGILHVVGGTLLDHARTARSGQSAAVTAQGD